jgi:hypothetical protein
MQRAGIFRSLAIIHKGTYYRATMHRSDCFQAPLDGCAVMH